MCVQCVGSWNGCLLIPLLYEKTKAFRNLINYSFVWVEHEIRNNNFPPIFFSLFAECYVKKNILSISLNAIATDCISGKIIAPFLDIVTPIIIFYVFSISVG